MSTVILTRPAQFTDKTRKYRVFVDDVQVATIGREERVELPVAPGEHRMVLRVDWVSSNTLSFRAADGEDVHLEGGNAVGIEPGASLKTLWRTFKALTVARDTYLYLKRL
jgi:hypothetical protein